MKLIITLSLLFLNIGLACADIMIDDFQQYTEGRLPTSWRTWPFQRSKAASVYKVGKEDENKFLQASDFNNVSVQLLRDFDWKTENYPILSWSWRANILPMGANETDPSVNDSACGVYVILSKARGEMLKYTWSTTADTGTVYEKKAGKAFIIAAETGAAKLGKWQSKKINIREDYRKYFGKELTKNPVAIAVLTDGNATHSKAACDYDNFKLEEKKN